MMQSHNNPSFISTAIQQELAGFHTPYRDANWCVPPETGQFLAWLAYTMAARQVLEIGTSIGYSGLWLLGAMGAAGHLHTLDVSPERQQQAMASFQAAGVAPQVTLYTGEAREQLPMLTLTGLDMVFIDAHKADYGWYLAQISPRLRPGGVVVADNTTSHGKAMGTFFEAVQQSGWPCVTLPRLGSGLWIITKPLMDGSTRSSN
jgi:predicted O-methyltransferase YrrM